MRNKRSLLQDKHIILQQAFCVNFLVIASIVICLVGKG